MSTAISRASTSLIIIVIVVVGGLGAFLASNPNTPTGSTRSSNGSTSSSSTPVSTFYFETTVTSTSCCTTHTINSKGGEVQNITRIESASIGIGGYPGVITYIPNSSKIYVTDFFSNKLLMINTTSKIVQNIILLPGTPTSYTAYSNNMLYIPVTDCVNMPNVTNSCNSQTTPKGSIVKINTTSNEIVGALPLSVRGLVVDHNTLWAITLSSLYEINATSGTLEANVSLGSFLLDLTMNHMTNTIYVTACGQMLLACANAELIEVNGSALKQARVLLSPFYDAINYNLVVDESTNTVYVIGEGSNVTLISIDGSSGKILYASNLAGSCARGGTIALNTEEHSMYISFSDVQYFLVLNTTSGKISNMYYTNGNMFDTVYDPGSNQVYATLNSTVVILSNIPDKGFVNTALLPSRMCLP